MAGASNKSKRNSYRTPEEFSERDLNLLLFRKEIHGLGQLKNEPHTRTPREQ